MNMNELKEDHLEIIFSPSLLYLLKFKENEKGSDLTEDEVIEIRDKAIGMMIRGSMLRKIEKSQGYRDIDPENCWVEWNQYKKQQ
jgi:hypothetical protein